MDTSEDDRETEKKTASNASPTPRGRKGLVRETID